MKMKFKKLYGGNAGTTTSTTPSSSNQNNQPWAPTIPYLQNVYSQAAKLYAQGPQQYTPWSQAATLTPDQNAYASGMQNYVNSQGTQNFLNQGQQSVQNLINGGNNPFSGVTNSSNPQLAGYLSNNSAMDPSQGLNYLMNNNLQDPNLLNALSSGTSQVNQAMGNINGLIQNGGGFGQNMANNLSNNAQNYAMTNALGSAFDNQNTMRMQAAGQASQNMNNQASLSAGLLGNQGAYTNSAMNLGLGNYASMMQNPINLLGLLNTAGSQNQTQAQQQIDNATNQWNFNQQAPYNALAQLTQLTTPNNAWSNRAQWGTQTSSSPISLGSAIGTGIGTVAPLIASAAA